MRMPAVNLHPSSKYHIDAVQMVLSMSVAHGYFEFEAGLFSLRLIPS